MSTPLIVLGDELAGLLINIAARSSQTRTLQFQDSATGDPVPITGSVQIEVAEGPTWVGAVAAGAAEVVWSLTPQQTDLRPGRHGATLVRVDGAVRDVVARGLLVVR